MIDTHPTSTSTSTPPSPPSSLPPNTQRQTSKLTKKQKKALAFRDKSSKSKTKDTTINRDEQEVEMEDLHVPDVEKPPRTRNASASLQMGNVENQKPEGASGGGAAPSAGTTRTSGDASSSHKDKTHQDQRQNPPQKRKRVSEVGDKQHRGDRDGQEKPRKKSKRERLDGVDDELDRVGAGGRIAKEKASHKKRKGAKVESGVDGAEEEGEGKEMSDGEGEGGVKEKGKQRFILFVGNLKYTTSVNAIQSHFSACDPPPEIRLLTPKASVTGKITTKSKGCAFLEFSNKAALQQALKQHHSMLEDRMINVELTAGGGGKGEKRMEKLRERNKELLGQRKKKADKKGKKEALPSRPDKPQRYSATSGMKQSAPEHNRTWTVGDTADDEVHRGGQKQKKSRGSRKSKARDWGTGVNAIPVG